MTLAHSIIDRFPGWIGLIGVTSSGMATMLEGPAKLVTMLVGLATLIILSPKLYRRLRTWARFARRYWPRRRRTS